MPAKRADFVGLYFATGLGSLLIVATCGQQMTYTVDLPCSVVCPSVPVEYTCTVNSNVIVWIVRDRTGTELGMEILHSGISKLNTSLQVGTSPFNVALTVDNGISGIASVISSNGSSNISGYELQCQTTNEVTATCTITDQGLYEGLVVNSTVCSTSSSTSLNLFWTEPTNYTPNCIVNYLITIKDANSWAVLAVVNTNSTETAYTFTNLPDPVEGGYQIVIAAIDSANRTGPDSNAVVYSPSAIIITQYEISVVTIGCSCNASISDSSAIAIISTSQFSSESSTSVTSSTPSSSASINIFQPLAIVVVCSAVTGLFTLICTAIVATLITYLCTKNHFIAKNRLVQDNLHHNPLYEDIDEAKQAYFEREEMEEMEENPSYGRAKKLNIGAV